MSRYVGKHISTTQCNLLPKYAQVNFLAILTFLSKISFLGNFQISEKIVQMKFNFKMSKKT